MLPNSIDYVIAYFAITISKNVIVPIGVQSKPMEIINTIDYCEIDLIVTSYAYRELVRKCFENYSFTVSVLFVEDGTIEKFNTDKYQKHKSDSIIEGDDSDMVVIMLHTSGTTSKPKRVMLTHKNLICNIESNIASLNLSDKDVTLISMPIHFGYCNTAQLLTHIYLGASIIILDGVFWPKRFFEIIQKEKVTNFTGVPSMLLMLLDYRYANSYDITSLRYICFGGGNMPVDKLKLLIEKFKTVGFVQTYGQTEASPRLTALLPEDSVTKIGSVGIPISNVSIKICSENGREVENNKIGEIVVKGPNIMKGYYKQPEITKKVLKSGWLHTGDLGYLHPDGWLYVLGRFKSLLIANDGEKYSPEGIEETIAEQSKYIDYCILYNNQSPYTAGLIVPNKMALREYIEKQDVEPDSMDAYRVMLKKIQSELMAYRVGGKHAHLFPERWLPAVVAVLPEVLNEQNGMINSTMKVVRAKVYDRFKEEIDYLYTPEGKEITNKRNLQNLKQLIS